MAQHKATPGRAARRDTARSGQAPRHGARDNKSRRIRPGAVSRPVLLTAAVALVGVLGLAAFLLLPARGRGGPVGCPTLRVVVAASYRPVVESARSAMAAGTHCAELDLAVADGRTAGRDATSADVWIPDDAAWAAPSGAHGRAAPSAGQGPVLLATSPVYFLTDPVTANRITSAGGGWLGLARLVHDRADPVRLATRDPAASGDGMLALGALGEAVWMDQGMNASAEALAAAVPLTRLVRRDYPLLPARGEVALVPERELAARFDGLTVLAPTDHTAWMRYAWLPSAAALADQARKAALDRLAGVLTGPDTAGAVTAAGLRPATDDARPAADGLPAMTAPAFEVLGPHHVAHVLATWSPADRRSDLLVAVDVSGSMQARAAGSDTALIDLVKQGITTLGSLLPDDSRLTLWEFGTGLDPPRDYRTLLPRTELDRAGRATLGQAIGSLQTRETGTGLYDTILAAYRAGQDGYRPDAPTHVVVFTDGRNEFDPGSISPDQLSAQLAASANPQRPVALTVISFGAPAEADALSAILKPVNGYVERLNRGDEVGATFIHLSAGGLHG